MSSLSATSFRERMRAAAAQQNQNDETPIARRPPPRKRTRDDSGGVITGSDDDRYDSPLPPLISSMAAGPVTRNAAVAVRNFAKKQKLRGDQLTQLDAFLDDIQTVREGKLFTLLLSMQNDVGNIIVATPAFTVSPQLKTNIQSYSLSVLISPKLAQYRGDLPVQHVWNILKKHSSDLPPGIENIPADMKTLTSEIQDQLTQARSNCKKKLFASVRIYRTDENKNKTVVHLDPAQHQNLFALAQAFVEGTKCRITNALCGRIALMRDIYLQNSGTSFWVDLDAALVLMRQEADGNEDARDAMFEDLIESDKKAHGAVDIVYQSTHDIQQEVDDLIDATSADAASTATDRRESSPPPEEDSEDPSAAGPSGTEG